jgi:hypothetical protein
MQITSIELFELLKPKLGEKEAKTLVAYVEERAEEKINQKKDVFLTKDDKIDIMRSMYIVGVVQYLAILGSMLAIFSFMK